MSGTEAQWKNICDPGGLRSKEEAMEHENTEWQTVPRIEERMPPRLGQKYVQSWASVRGIVSDKPAVEW